MSRIAQRLLQKRYVGFLLIIILLVLIDCETAMFFVLGLVSTYKLLKLIILNFSVHFMLVYKPYG
jgi:hypothetical protein